MPEGPEVKHFMDQIKWIKHKTLNSIRVLNMDGIGERRYRIEVPLPVKIKDVVAKGKELFWLLEHGDGIAFTHGMSGMWLEEADPYNRMEFIFGGGRVLYFNDVRKFAHVVYTKDIQSEMDMLGPSVLDKPTYEQFYEGFGNKNTEIAKILLDQKVVSGIGNYLRAEILWEAKISPYRRYRSLNEQEKKALYDSAIRVSEHHYRYPNDFNFNVYEKITDPYGNPVSHDKMSNRTIHWVKNVQK